jgi:hypothetical protein
MSSRLVPCSACDRHVRLSEEECPFCGAAMGVDGIPQIVARPKHRLGRAALFAFGAAAAGVVAIGGCGDDDGSIVSPYGAPPADSGLTDSGALDVGTDATSDAAADAATDAPTDAEVDAMPDATDGSAPDGG